MYCGAHFVGNFPHPNPLPARASPGEGGETLAVILRSSHRRGGQESHLFLDTSESFWKTLRLMKQSIVTLDLEGVLVPEIWIAFADKTGIPELRRTTRDEPDYDKLMQGRIEILNRHSLKLSDIQTVIGSLNPLPGGKEFLDKLRTLTQVLILSDTFEQFASPLMRQLSWPTLLCHRLVVEDDRIVGYNLRIPDQKKQTVAALKSLNYHVIAAGDSFNDTAMLAEADLGFLFRAPDSIRKQFPKFRALETYTDLLKYVVEGLTQKK